MERIVKIEPEDVYLCPICQSELSYDEDVYLDEDDIVIGCRACVSVSSAHLHCKEAVYYEVV